MIRHILFMFSRTYRANCIMRRVLEYDCAGVRLVAVQKAEDHGLRLAG